MNDECDFFLHIYRNLFTKCFVLLCATGDGEDSLSVASSVSDTDSKKLRLEDLGLVPRNGLSKDVTDKLQVCSLWESVYSMWVKCKNIWIELELET